VRRLLEVRREAPGVLLSPDPLQKLWSAAPEAARSRRAGRWEEAERRLNERLAAEPERAELYALKAELLRASPERREGEAVEAARRGVALAPDRGWARAALARCLLARGDAAGARRELDAAPAAGLDVERAFALLASGDASAALAQLRAVPASADSALAEAGALSRLGRLDEALSAARRARAAAPRPGLPPAAELEADLLAALSRWDDAASARRALAGRGRGAAWPLPDAPTERARVLDALAARAARRPRDAWAWAWLGDAAARAGDARGAEALDRAVRLAPGLGWARLARARLRAAAGDLRGASADARAASRERAGAGEALAFGADLAAALGRGAESERGYGRALAAGWARPEMRARRAEILDALGRAREARQELDLCLEESPGHPRGAALRARWRTAAGDRVGAESDLSRARGETAAAGVRGPFEDVGPGEGPARRGRGRVGLDPRVELAGLLQSAATGAETPGFLREAEPALAACADEALRRFVPLLPSGLAEDFRRAAAARGNAAFPWFGITQMLMSVSPPPALSPVRRAWSDGGDLRLLARLREFGARSGFWRFCASADARLRPRLRPLAKAAGGEDYAATVSRYAGRRVSAFYEIAVSPLLRGVNLRAILTDEDGGRGARTVLCPGTSEQDLRALAPESPFVLWSGWHEHLHLLLDPWTALHEPEARRHKSHYERVAPGSRRKSWLDCAAEHFVRAATQRLVALRRGEEAAEELAREDAAEGYPFARRLAASLREEYEPRRERYPSLLAFLPRWLEDWEEGP